MITLWWILAALILYSLFGYGLIWIGLSKLFGPRPEPPAKAQTATMLIAARNEEADIAAKIRSVLDQDLGDHDLSILVVSDGSDDRTVAEVEGIGDPRVRAIDRQDHDGKAAALNAGLAEIPDDHIVIFSDANSKLHPGSIRAILAPFGHAEIGGAVGRLSIPEKGGFLAKAERLFWAYDNALKTAEDRVGGTISAQGTLYALRRALVRPVPEAMADDLVNSLGVVDQGYRLAFPEGAVAEEPITDKTGDEFGRRVRSTERGWRGLMHHARLMNPARTGLYGLQLFSHKGMRRLVAFLLPLFFVVTLFVAWESWFYLLALLGQLVVYGLGFGAVLSPAIAKLPGASPASLFTMGHVAMARGIIRAARGVKSTKWVPVRDA